jgi:hypothetical protein
LAALELPHATRETAAMLPKRNATQPHDAALAAMLSRVWFALALAALVVAGVFAFIPVIGRTPGLCNLIQDPTLAKRFLVVHVDLALLVWFGVMRLALFQLWHASDRVIGPSLFCHLGGSSLTPEAPRSNSAGNHEDAPTQTLPASLHLSDSLISGSAIHDCAHP